MNKTLLVTGLLIVGINAAFMLRNMIGAGITTLVAVAGIRLIDASGRSRIKRIG